MKRLFTILFAVSLAVTANSPFFTVNVQAKDKENPIVESMNKISKEAINQFDEVLDSTEEKYREDNLPATGASYGISEYKGAPDITAASAILMDARSGAVLYSKQSDTKRYPASITKIMTTLLAIENCQMSDKVTFTKEAVYGVEAGSSSAGIGVGAELTVEETLYALMLVSANEAGAAIAEHISGSSEEFGKLMTLRAKELGCTGTQFKNPHGLPDEEHYTTAHDMGLILQECIKHEEFRRISSTLSYTITARDSLPTAIELTNHAKILRSSFPDYYYEYAVGAKTGFTQAALNTLVTYAEKDGVQLLCVILKDQGADCSYYDTKALYEWGFKKVKTVYPYKKFDVNEALSSNKNFDEKEVDTWLGLEPKVTNDFPVLVSKDDKSTDFQTSFRLDENVKTGRLGYADLKVGDELVYSAEVTYDITSDAAQKYISTHGDDDEEIEGADAKDSSKSSIRHKLLVFTIRLAIACILVYIIMTLIHKYLDDKKRQNKKKTRKPSGRSANGNAPSSSSNKAKVEKSLTSSNPRKSSGRTSSSRPDSSTERRRRSNKNTRNR